MRIMYKILVGKPEGKLRRPRHRCENSSQWIVDLKYCVIMWTGFISLSIEIIAGLL
jgi:hypothetical protein